LELNTVKIPGLDTKEASEKQHEVLCKCSKAKKVMFHHSYWCGRPYRNLTHLESS